MKELSVIQVVVMSRYVDKLVWRCWAGDVNVRMANVISEARV